MLDHPRSNIHWNPSTASTFPKAGLRGLCVCNPSSAGPEGASAVVGERPQFCVGLLYGYIKTTIMTILNQHNQEKLSSCVLLECSKIHDCLELPRPKDYLQ